MARPSPTRNPPQRNVLGLMLRQAREAKGWSQADLARHLQLIGWDVERTVITKIELRRRCITDYELLLIARVLKLNVGELGRASARELVRLASGA